MLTYAETILQKVSFNKELFAKELKKSISLLQREEVLLLKSWVINNYGNCYDDVITEVFN